MYYPVQIAYSIECAIIEAFEDKRKFSILAFKPDGTIVRYCEESFNFIEY